MVLAIAIALLIGVVVIGRVYRARWDVGAIAVIALAIWWLVHVLPAAPP